MEEENAESSPEQEEIEEAEEKPEARPERTMYKITCSECKKESEVPFKPDGTRPVYCPDCYKSKRQR